MRINDSRTPELMNPGAVEGMKAVRARGASRAKASELDVVFGKAHELSARARRLEELVPQIAES